jgi:hypothetical protein
MNRKSESYDIGKKGEHESWVILEELGFIRPEKNDRKNIIDAFSKKGVEIKSRGFDVVGQSEIENFRKTKKISKMVLYEVKTAGKNRKQEVQDDFANLGFTLTSSERHNADVLGKQYKFIFLNLKTKSHMVCSLNDFFNNEIANIYPTWSVFITKGISPKKTH